jgi:FlaG/FlaF family flagellin (archaellin)
VTGRTYARRHGSGPKILVIVIAVVVLLLLAVPVVVILAAVIASFVLGPGEETPLLLVPACDPAFGRGVRQVAFGSVRRRLWADE